MKNILVFATSDSLQSEIIQSYIEKQVRRRTTELNGRLRELQERNAYLLQLHTEKNDWLQMLVHDLKNPLAGILLAASFLERYWKRMSLTEFLRNTGTIQYNAHRMNTIVTRVLSIGALESGTLDLKFDHINIAKMLGVAAADYSDRASKKGMAIQLDLESEDLYIYADRCALLEIIDNLLSNAVKYSLLNTIIHVGLRTVFTKEGQSRVRVEFRDQGPGIRDDEAHSLFTKFARLSSEPTGGEHSSGLGLAMVYKLTRAMQGNVWCESEYGKGATFIVEFAPSAPNQYLDVRTIEVSADMNQSLQILSETALEASLPLAIGGFDTVGYFLMNKPVQGNSAIYADWQGKRWLFEREYHRELFLHDPERFTPKYNGYCALGMSNNYSAPGDPESWRIVENELFLAYDEKAIRDWEVKLHEYIAEADKNWNAESFTEYVG